MSTSRRRKESPNKLWSIQVRNLRNGPAKRRKP